MVQAMKLKNILIVVNDIQESICFYKEIFGLDIITKQEGNVILTEGLVLQDAKVWADVIEKSTTPYNNLTELYFEDNDVEGLVDKLISRKKQHTQFVPSKGTVVASPSFDIPSLTKTVFIAKKNIFKSNIKET